MPPTTPPPWHWALLDAAALRAVRGRTLSFIPHPHPHLPPPPPATAPAGNTGIALAAFCAARGYKLSIIMPAGMTEERTMAMTAYGADIVVVPTLEEGMDVARTMEAAGEGLLLDQFHDPANPESHRRGTGKPPSLAGRDTPPPRCSSSERLAERPSLAGGCRCCRGCACTWRHRARSPRAGFSISHQRVTTYPAAECCGSHTASTVRPACILCPAACRGRAVSQPGCWVHTMPRRR
jgi:hypothetical protein